MGNYSKIDVALDDIYRTIGNGEASTAMINSLYGINHMQTSQSILSNKIHHGFTFFTRPQMNLTTGNIRNSRLLTPLLTNNPLSIQQWVRTTLDPRLMHGYKKEMTGYGPLFNSQLTNNKQAFIPHLTNHIRSISGFPDYNSPVFTSAEGRLQESFSMVDGSINRYGAEDLTVSYRNTVGSPVLLLHYTAMHYASLVYEGKIRPYMDSILQKRIDYMSRIYRILLDPTKTYIEGIAATIASFPTSLPMGDRYNFSVESPFNDITTDLVINYRSVGFIYEDEMLFKQFNQVVECFNPDMGEWNRTPNIDAMIKIPREHRMIFNNRGYPKINLDTKELEWWIEKDHYHGKLAHLYDLSKSAYGTPGALVNNLFSGAGKNIFTI